MRLTRNMIDRLAGQTPCLCGSIDTWHPQCYAEVASGQLRKEMVEAYKVAATELKRRYAASAKAVIAVAALN